MSTKQRYRLRVGLFVLLGMGIIAGLILAFTSAPRILKSRNTYYAEFPTAPGIGPGTPVRRSGVNVGEVQAIKLDPRTGVVRLVLRIDPDFPPRTEEDVTILTNLISGDATVDFVPREPQKLPLDLGEALPAGAELVGVTPPTPADLVRQAQDVLPSAQLSLDQIRRSVEKFDQLGPKMEEALIAFRDFGKAGQEIVPELRRTNDELRAFITEVRTYGPQLARTNETVLALLQNANAFVEELRQITTINEPRLVKLINQMTETIDSVNAMLSPENRKLVDRTLKNVADASDKLPQVAQNVDESLAQFRKTIERIDGTITEAEAILKDVRKISNSVSGRIDGTLDETDAILKDVRGVTSNLKERTDKVLANVDSGAEELNKILIDVRAIIREAARSDGTLSRILGDPSLYQNLDAVANGAAKLLPRIEKILEDVEVFADKIARHPERLGVGGAVRPDTGLKEGSAVDPYEKTSRPTLLPGWMNRN